MGEELTPDEKEYRRDAVNAQRKSQDHFDKLVVTLSAGALGVSFAFVTDIIGSDSAISLELLVWAWGMWSASLVVILCSHFLSVEAFRTVIRQVDDGTIYDEPPGRGLTKWTGIANIFAAILFMAGLLFMIIFARINLGG